MAKGKIIGALSAVGASLSYNAYKGTSKYLSELSSRIEKFQRNMWLYEKRLGDKFISTFGSDGMLKIIYDDGKEIVLQNGVEPISKLPYDIVSEFREKWMNGVFCYPDDIKTSSI